MSENAREIDGELADQVGRGVLGFWTVEPEGKRLRRVACIVAAVFARTLEA